MSERQVSRDEVEQSVRAARYPNHDPARWALPLIAEADRLAGGTWALVELDAEAVGRLWLPPHQGEPCHGDRLPLGDSADAAGQPAQVAAAWLRRHAERYSAANPSCWGRIANARDTEWGPVVLAPFPVGDRTAPSTATLIVIDGLHRVIGWSLAPDDAGRRTLPAFVAGGMAAVTAHRAGGR